MSPKFTITPTSKERAFHPVEVTIDERMVLHYIESGIFQDIKAFRERPVSDLTKPIVDELEKFLDAINRVKRMTREESG